MKLNSISSQQKWSLKEYYSLDLFEGWGKMSTMMVDLVKLLEESKGPDVWVYTSHDELIINDEDDYKNWLVLIKVIYEDPSEEKQLYKITSNTQSPWHHLTGFAEDSYEAYELILYALENIELKRERNVLLDSN